MSNATNSKIRVSVSQITQKTYFKRVMGWANDRSSLKSIGHWFSAAELFFELFLEL